MECVYNYLYIYIYTLWSIENDNFLWVFPLRMVIFLSYVSFLEGTYAHDIGDIMEFMIRYKVNLCLIPADVGKLPLNRIVSVFVVSFWILPSMQDIQCSDTLIYIIYSYCLLSFNFSLFALNFSGLPQPIVGKLQPQGGTLELLVLYLV